MHKAAVFLLPVNEQVPKQPNIIVNSMQGGFWFGVWFKGIDLYTLNGAFNQLFLISKYNVIIQN